MTEPLELLNSKISEVIKMEQKRDELIKLLFIDDIEVPVCLKIVQLICDINRNLTKNTVVIPLEQLKEAMNTNSPHTMNMLFYAAEHQPEDVNKALRALYKERRCSAWSLDTNILIQN